MRKGDDRPVARKSDIDRDTAFDLGDEPIANVSFITETFLKHLMFAIARGDVVKLKSFGTFRLADQGGGPPLNGRFGHEGNTTGEQRRLRVHFSKSSVFKRETNKRHKENEHGKARRR